MRQRNILFDKKLLNIPGLGGDAANYSPVARRSAQVTVTTTSQNATTTSGADTTTTKPAATFTSSRDLAAGAAAQNRESRIAQKQAWGVHGASDVAMTTDPVTGKPIIDKEAQARQIMQEQIGNGSGSYNSGIPGDATFQNMVAGYMEARDIVHQQGIDLQNQLAMQRQYGNMPYGNGMMGNNNTAAAIGAGGNVIASLAQAFIKK